MKKKITICITIVVIMAILIAACNNNKDKSALTDTSQIDSSSADESTDINIEGSMDAADESTDASIEDSTDATDEESSGEVTTEAITKAEESGEAATEKETDAREAAAPATTKAVTATTKAATQPATTKAAQPQTQAPETKPVIQPATQAPKPTQPQTQAPKPTQPATKAPVWHEPEYRTEQVWVVDKAAWTEEVKTPKQVPVYDWVGYYECTCGFETKDDDEFENHFRNHMFNEEPAAYRINDRWEVVGSKTEYDITYIEHPAEGHHETKQVLVREGYWE